MQQQEVTLEALMLSNAKFQAVLGENVTARTREATIAKVPPAISCIPSCLST